ncbi:MAG: KH domain-containing protein [Clostridia bacterium]|nr:KH domain-containing protein [Oscillospiraceae bacterium]MBQ2828078.1 KH domain-containing protein [Clostridia bacterium]
MEELLVSIVKGLVESPDEVKVTSSTTEEEGLTVFHVSVAADDMGRVIGKQGRIAKAIRTVMRAAAIRKDVKVKVEID